LLTRAPELLCAAARAENRNGEYCAREIELDYVFKHFAVSRRNTIASFPQPVEEQSSSAGQFLEGLGATVVRAAVGGSGADRFIRWKNRQQNSYLKFIRLWPIDQ
jgi:hypothetical protein